MLQNAMAGSWEATALEGSRNPTTVKTSTSEQHTDHQNVQLPSAFESSPMGTDPVNGTVKVSIPLKRSRQDRDYDNARSSPLPRGRSPPPTSPPNLRGSFVPDRNEPQYTARDRRLEHSSRSPQSTKRRDRSGRWPPPSAHSPPRKRRPRAKLASSERTDRSKRLSRTPPPDSSRLGLSGRSSDARDLPGFRNLTWKAPGAEPTVNQEGKNDRAERADTNDSSPVAGDLATRQTAESLKIDFNGLTGVPTGPKHRAAPMSPDQSKAPGLSGRSHFSMDDPVSHHPHIFISAISLPAQRSIKKHLFRFLKRYVSKSSDIRMDESGWYIFFEDSSSGCKLLEMCYKDHHQQLLFSQYLLHMHRFINGQPIDVRDPSMTAHDTPNSIKVAADGISSLNQTPADDDLFPKGLGVTLHRDPVAEGKGDIFSTVNSLDAEAGVNGTTLSPPLADGILRHLRHSSPALRVPSRHDKDETSSSISGITGSDMSISKRLKCHVCQTNSGMDSDALVQCSSCPRRYHRRCHTRSPIPLNLDHDHSWQCHRCVKKKVQPKSRLSNTSPAVASPAASVGQPDQPPLKKLRLDFLHKVTSPKPDAISDRDNLIFNDGAIDHDAGIANHVKDVTNGRDQDSEDSYEPTDRLLFTNDDTQLFEANDLVAKSFAPSESRNQAAKTTPKTGKLSLLRKKVVPVASTEPEAADSLDLSKRSQQVMTEIAQENSPSKELSLLHDDEDDVLKQSGKSHKWSGGGTDKDIIQAGMDSLQPRDELQLVNGNDESHYVAAPHLTADSATQKPFDDIALPSATGQATSEDVFAAQQSLHSTSDNKTESFTPSKMTETPVMDPPQQSISSKQRRKPGAPAVSHCIKCQKTIAWQPSGTNKLCSRCKSEASAEPKSHPIDTPSLRAFEKVEMPSVNLHHTTAVVDSEGGTKTSPNAVRADVEMNDQDEDSDRPRANGLKPTKRAPAGTACEMCRKRRKRCTHVDLESTSLQDSVTADGYLASGADATEDDASGDDLNFWTAKPPLRAAESAANESTLLPKKNVGFTEELDDDVEMENLRSDLEGDSDENSPSAQPRTDEHISFQAKRKSQTRPATNDYDLGDSFSRPRDTYVKLIVMALGSAPNHRLKGNDIVQWVIQNIPSYEAKHRKWQGALRATMTLKRRGYNGGSGLWKIVDDGSKKNEGYVWELLPGVADDMLHWDPVLKRAVSPPSWRVRRDEQDAAGRAGEKRQRSPSEELSESPVRPTKARHTQADDASPAPGQASFRQTRPHADTLTKPPSPRVVRHLSLDGTSDSSDEEPIARKRKPKGTPSTSTFSKTFNPSPADSAAGFSLDRTVLRPTQEPSRIPQLQPIKRQLTTSRRTSGPTLPELMEIESKQTTYSAKSLYDEWPEYDPKNEFDQEAKIAEIKKRPTRKQRFGKQDSTVEMDTQMPVSRNVFTGTGWSPERPKAPNPLTTAFPWETGEENVVPCDSIEELFNLPANPVAVMHNGELAYRDASKNSRVVYKTGYA